MKNNRWELDVVSPVRATDGNLSLPQTPQRQPSQYLPPMPFQSPDCAPLKPQRNESITLDNQRVPKRHRRKKSKSLDVLFVSPKMDSPPPKPQRFVSRRNIFQQDGEVTTGQQRVRSRSLDLDMDLDVLLSPPCEQPRCSGEPSPAVSLPYAPAINPKSNAKPSSRVRGKQNHRRTRSRSLDLTLDFDFMSTPKCEKSCGPCQPSPSLVGSPPLKSPSDTATTEKKDNRTYRRRRSRSLDDANNEPNLPEQAENDCDFIPGGIFDNQRESMWIIPTFLEIQDMRRISSLTMDDDSFRNRRTLVVNVADRQLKRISSLTMDDDSSFRRTQRTVISTLPEEVEPDTEENNEFAPISIGSKPSQRQIKRISSLTMDDDSSSGRHQHTAAINCNLARRTRT